jgi:hypothetical protein
MKYRLLLIFCLIITGLFSNAQNFIKGRVLDGSNLQPLEAATVILDDRESFRVLTDQFGNFSFPVKDTGSHSVRVSFIGFLQVKLLANAGEKLKITLFPDAYNLKDVVVIQRRGLSKFSSLSKIDLDLKPVRNTQELLRLVPGLFIAQHAGGGKAEQIFLRGFDCDHGTDVAINLDGMPINMVSHAHGQGYADAHFIIPETINNIDFGCGP